MLRHIDAPDQEYLSVKAAARWLGVPANTLRDWWTAGHIPAPIPMRRGRILRYSWRVLFAVRVWIECGRLPPPATQPAGEQKKEAQRSRKKPEEAQRSDSPNIGT